MHFHPYKSVTMYGQVIYNYVINPRSKPENAWNLQDLVIYRDLEFCLKGYQRMFKHMSLKQ